jgi:hypothetical protein
MIPYNSISLKSNPPQLHSIARALDSGAREMMPMASIKVTRATLFHHGKRGRFSYHRENAMHVLNYVRKIEM